MTYTPEQIAKAVEVMKLLGWTAQYVPNWDACKWYNAVRPAAKWLPVVNLSGWERTGSDSREVLTLAAYNLLRAGYFDAVAWRLPTHPEWLERDTVEARKERSMDGRKTYFMAWINVSCHATGLSLTDATLDLLLAVLPMLEESQ
jgi:hypothetical protein